jgi:hypothetical protein
MFAERDRMRDHWMMRTPIGAIEFLNSLVSTVAAHWDVQTGVHVLPDGVLGGSPEEPRHIFMEPGVLELDGLQIVRTELTSLSEGSDHSADLVIATLPMGGPPGGRNRPDEMIDRLVASARCLSQDGVGVLLTTPFYRTFRIGRLAEALFDDGIYVHGVVNTPPRFLQPHAIIQPLFVVISRRPTQTTFALDCKNIEDLTINISSALNHLDTGHLRTSIEMNIFEFKGFEHWYAQREIDTLEGDFTRYEKSKLCEVSRFVNLARRGEEFEDIPDSVYLPMIGNGPAVESLSQTSMKHESYAQLVVDTTRATPAFLCSYLNTKYFRLYLEAEKLTRSQTPPRLNREQVRLLPVALPDLETQERITNNIRKLSELRSLVDEISQNLSVNPVSATSMTQQVDEALAVFGKLSAADQVLALIRQGESRSVEFKATFSLPVQSVGLNQEDENKDLRPQLSQKQLRETLETSSLKTIVAFMNSEGGDLLIGVHDNQSINGLNDEIKQMRGNSTDKFLLYFVTKVKDRIGAAWLPHIKHSIVEIDGKSVLRVQCERSQEPAYLDNDVFYIRTNPETTPLKGRDANEYIRRHFQLPTAVLG